jgi:hypothetical protein
MRAGLFGFALALGIGSLAQAHSQEPGYRRIFTQDWATQTYTLKNAYEFPATYRIEVLTKEEVPLEDGWKLSEGQSVYKLEPGSERRFTVLINMQEHSERKLLICTTLQAIGYEETLPGNISRICSRLWVIGPR